nr:hypothetical protein [Rhodococcus erythropolis]
MRAATSGLRKVRQNVARAPRRPDVVGQGGVFVDGHLAKCITLVSNIDTVG